MSSEDRAGSSVPGVTAERTPLLDPPVADTNVQQDERTIIAQELPFTRLVLVMGTAWFGVFLGALDSTIIATLSAPISSEFRSLSLLSWLAAAYLISNAACQPIAGRLTDIFGRGPGLAVSNILFAVGNLICGLATNQYAMILGRVIAGIGGGGMMSIATFLGSDLIPLRRRGLIQGIGNLWYGSGAMLGAVVGGLLNDYSGKGWRLAFLIQVPPALISALAVWVLVKVPAKQSDKTYLARIDFLGVLFSSSSLILLLLGLSTGGTLVPWKHPLPLTTLPVSVILFMGFIWWEGTVPQPIIPVSLLRDRTVLAACFASLLITMLAMTATFYVPLYLQVLGDSTTTAGLKLLPSPLGASVGALGTGYAMGLTGKYMRLGILGNLTLITGSILFTLQTEHSPAWLSGLALFVVGGGYSAVLTTAQVACIAAVDHSQQAVVTSVTCKSRHPLITSMTLMLVGVMARSVGGTLGITVASAVYQNTLKERLWARYGDEPGGPGEIRRILDGLEELKHLPEGWWKGVMASFMEAFGRVWLMMLCWAVLALVSVSFMKQHKLYSRLDRA